MALKELVEVSLTNEQKHHLRYVCDERGYVKFRDVNTGECYYQAIGNIWYVEKGE